MSLSKQFHIYSINDMIRHYERGGGHWFSKDTLRFFKSRISDQIFFGVKQIYFVSSEKGPNCDSPRRYTVLSYTPENHQIDTVGEFQKYKTLAAAVSVAKTWASLGQDQTA